MWALRTRQQRGCQDGSTGFQTHPLVPAYPLQCVGDTMGVVLPRDIVRPCLAVRANFGDRTTVRGEGGRDITAVPTLGKPRYFIVESFKSFVSAVVSDA